MAGTRSFARRQDSWFRKDPRINWLRCDCARTWLAAAYALCGSPAPVPEWKTEPMRRWSFAKGHGTQNDFVLLVDREAMLDLGPAEAAFLCDRRAGIGGDGVLRAVLAKHVDGGRATDRCGSWTTATPTARSPRCAATASGCSSGF